MKRTLLEFNLIYENKAERFVYCFTIEQAFSFSQILTMQDELLDSISKIIDENGKIHSNFKLTYV